MKKHLIMLLAGSLIVLGFIGEARAELFFGGYMGVASTNDSDVELIRPGGTNLTFSDVSWDDDSFASPLYYGVRAGYFFRSHPNWGMAIDFTHAKMYAELDSTVSVSGTRSGAPVSGQERLRDTFEVLEFSDGHNLLTLNGMYRWMGLGGIESGFFQPPAPLHNGGTGHCHAPRGSDGGRRPNL